MQLDVDLKAILERLELLEAKEKIRHVLSSYSRGADRTDPEAARSVLWPEARLVVGAVESVGHQHDTAETFVEPLFGKYIGQILAATHHLMGNMIIEVHGKTAHSETYAIAHHRSFPTPESNDAVVGLENVSPQDSNKELELIIGMRYLDRLEEREGVWKIIERRLVFDWSQRGIYSGVDSGGLWSGTQLYGARKPDDPSYQR